MTKKKTPHVEQPDTGPAKAESPQRLTGTPDLAEGAGAPTAPPGPPTPEPTPPPLMTFDEQVTKAITVLAENQQAQQRSLQALAGELAKLGERWGTQPAPGGDITTAISAFLGSPIGATLVGAATDWLKGGSAKEGDPMLDLLLGDAKKEIRDTVLQSVRDRYAILGEVAAQVRSGRVKIVPSET